MSASLPPTHRTELPDPLPLIGRTQELSRLEALMEEEGDGSRIVFVRGEPGVGKTRLAKELVTRARGRSWKVALGRAYPVEAGTPYAIFSDAWLPILNGMDSNTLTVLSRGGEPELRYLFPALGTGDDGMDTASSEEPEEFRTRLMWNFAQFLKRYAARHPVLCVLDDIQWADDSSIELMHFLARQITDEPILIVCTYNDRARDSSKRLVDAERSLTSIGAGEVLGLEALTRDQVCELVSRSFGVDTDVVREFGSVLYGWTRGNTFFVEEVLKALVGSGRLKLESGAWVGWDAKDFDLPGSIRDAIMARVASFSEVAQKVVEIASVVGTRVTYDVLESIMDMDQTDVLTGLEELCDHGILNEHVDGPVVIYDFRYPLVRQTLYEEFGLQRVRVLHGVVAEALEEYYGSEAEDHADELAFHFARTAGNRLRGKASRYLIAAGRKAFDRRADQEAISYFETAVERIDASDDEGRRQMARVVPLLARSHTHVGHFDKAVELWSQALAAMPEDDPKGASVHRALGITHVWRGDHSAAAAAFESGLQVARGNDDDGSTVRLLVAKAHGLHEVGRADDALETLHEALPLAEEMGDAGLLARVHRALALLHVWVGPPEDAERHGHRAIELAQEVGSLSIEFWARWGLAVLTGMRGETEAMAQAIDEVTEIADRARSPVLRLWTADMAVELAYGQGDWDAGVTKGEQAISVARSLNQRTLLPRLLVWTSQFHVARGDLERAEELIDEAVAMAGIDADELSRDVHQVVPTYTGLAFYRVALGDYDDAIAAAEKGLEIAEGTGYILWALHQLLPVLAEACLWAGHIDRAESVGKRLRAHAEKIDHRLGRAWADACDSLVIWKRGDAAGAVDLMRSAADELEAIPMIWPATRLRRQLAGRLFEIGRREEALEELGRVHEVCVRVRAGLELEKTRGMYREMDVRPPPMPSRDNELGLTATELKVATLVAQGLSNKAAAVQLRCAVRTVSTHLSNIYAKLGIGGSGARLRLAKILREAGLVE
ncbi:MAG: AAA family ATPase [Longimicrobiales bacterium]|nr:AAA family ATPase [Longimicrobiales bacterium]